MFFFFWGGGGLVSEDRHTSLKMSLFLFDNRYICATSDNFEHFYAKKKTKTHPIQPSHPFFIPLLHRKVKSV